MKEVQCILRLESSEERQRQLRKAVAPRPRKRWERLVVQRVGETNAQASVQRAVLGRGRAAGKVQFLEDLPGMRQE